MVLTVAVEQDDCVDDDPVKCLGAVVVVVVVSRVGRRRHNADGWRAHLAIVVAAVLPTGIVQSVSKMSNADSSKCVTVVASISWKHHSILWDKAGWCLPASLLGVESVALFSFFLLSEKSYHVHSRCG